MLQRTPDKVAEADLERGPSAALVTVLAIAAGALVANLYYAQPLVAAIGPSIGIGPDLAGAIVSITQIGYGIGLLLLVPLADRVENRTLVLVTLTATTFGLLAAALATNGTMFLIASLVIGLCSTGAQVLLPFVAQLVPKAHRGRIVGNVMAGVLTGIMLARPVALFISGSFGWRAVFFVAAALVIAVGFALARSMPRYRPANAAHYGRMLTSMIDLVRGNAALRWRAAYQGLMFGAFNMFWTAVPLMLADRFGLDQHGIGLFALAGAGGALAAPLAGRLADRGFGGALTAAAMAVLTLAFFASGWTAAAWAWALTGLVVFTILIDAAVQANQVVSQRIIFSVPAATRGRVNAIYMTITFAGGAVGSVLGTITFHGGGWGLTTAVGGAIGMLLLVLFAAQRRTARSA